MGPDGLSFGLIGAYQAVLDPFAVTTGDPSPSQQLVISTAVTFASTMIGKTVECTSGANLGQQRQIQEIVSAHSIRMQRRWDNPITIGDVFTVLEPAVTIENTAGGFGMSFQGTPLMGVKAIKFQSAGSFFTLYHIDVYQEGCEYDLGGHGALFFAPGGGFRSANGGTARAWNALGDASPFSGLHRNGTFIHDGRVIADYGSVNSGGGVFQNCLVEYGGQTQVYYTTTDYQDCLIYVTEMTSFIQSSDPLLKQRVFGDAQALSTNFNGFSYPGLSLVNIQGASSAEFQCIDVSNSDGNGIGVQDAGAAAQLYDVGGTSVGGVGLWAHGGVQITAGQNDSLFGFPDNTITGDGGDVLIGGHFDDTGATTGGLLKTWDALAIATTSQGNLGVTGDAGDRVAMTPWYNEED